MQSEHEHHNQLWFWRVIHGGERHRGKVLLFCVLLEEFKLLTMKTESKRVFTFYLSMVVDRTQTLDMNLFNVARSFPANIIRYTKWTEKMHKAASLLEITEFSLFILQCILGQCVICMQLSIFSFPIE